ncbi:MAG: phosphoglycolate phosphatase [Candidatus Methanoliparum thermophilum]|uniref:Phosphoglycolate phosphatase n=1 Tax=Methanoliparum thermophilum TaxID=2491083 RepID=A0A520KTH2_METT2|nr:MAG: phosphoglycolate phosphatase [Candidatus Methanoliparum thermophilum]
MKGLQTSNIDCIAIDIDGTLTNKDRILNPNALDTIQRLSIPVVLVSGNVACFVSAISRLIDASEEVVAENGGVVKLSYDGEEIILGDKNLCIKAYNHLKNFLDVKLIDMRYRLSEVTIKSGIDIKMANDILKEFDVEIVDSGFAIHIKKRGINKMTGLSYLAGKKGWNIDRMVAIGDSENDLEMIKGVGFGIAVGNSDEDLKMHADYVTKGRYGDGVVEALTYLNLV